MRVRVEIHRNGRDDMEKDFEKLTLKHKKRKLRIQRSGREKLQQNLKAKKGMRLLCEEGMLRKYSDRYKQNSSETIDWRKFIKQSKKNNDIVNLKDPDLVQRLNEETRKENKLMTNLNMFHSLRKN